MSDYASLKVPELKKLLQEKSLPVTGNKADLVARLQEHDKSEDKPAAAPAAQEDEIDWDDEEPAKASEPAKPAEPAAAAPAAEQPATESVTPAAQPESTTEATATATEDKTSEEETAAKPAAAAEEAKPAEEAPKTDFSAHLPASTADEEMRKRADRAKRFGIEVDENEEAKKKAERAARFGADNSSSAVVSGLDAALPEKRERKRGRGAESGNDAGDRGAKRQQGNGGGRNNRGGNNNNRRGNNSGRGRNGGGGGRGREQQQSSRPSVALDPAEKAKAEARAKRFAGTS